MRKLLVLFAFLFVSSSTAAQVTIPETALDHAWVNGVYWNSGELPGWGFFANVQEESLFAAVYGYMGQDSTFITLQGVLTSLDPLIFEGDVYFVTQGGTQVADVGNFTWRIEVFEGEPAVSLDISSNILNRTDLELVRFSYVEVDKVDVITGGKWNIIRRIGDTTYGDFYSIEDIRVQEQGETFAGVIDLGGTDYVGAVGYLPAQAVYSLLIPFTATTNIYYVFYASNTDLYGRYWILEEGELPAGNGNYFRGAADNFQSSYSGGDLAKANNLAKLQKHAAPASSENRAQEIEANANSGEVQESMFPESVVLDSYKALHGKDGG